ncbi:nose resistant to fluoxetine protein 6-like [Anticarsia gemmatalis]|uniref:nose resistant to fluoxetine protein 6-like n=1 Tax=Anticarsia gemmatalis TaxID=129554 RepID=UPI003F769589
MLNEDVLRWLVIVVTGSSVVSAMDITYAQHAQFPKLFHLDNYEDCLGAADGLYCVGTFHVRTMKERDPTYELMKEYSLDRHNFNRTLIHRGYCVSSRCPSLSHVHDASKRFERCAALQAKRRSMRAMLTELSYCRTHAEEHAPNIDAIGMPHVVFLCVVFAIFVLNAIGTVYDVMKKDEKKIKWLTNWSVVSNWPQLVGPYPAGDPRLAAILPLEGGRVFLIMMVVFTHSGCIHHRLYMENPKYIEEMSHHWLMMPLQNGTSAVQLFIILSSFLLAHSLLSSHQPLSFRVLPRLVAKRLLRLMPVYLLVIGFGATWWPLLRTGPLWHAAVDAESHVCRRKFWAHFFFVHNFVEPEKHCFVQTWFLAVDTQLYILAGIITLCLSRVRRIALPLLGGAFIITVLLNATLAYINHWKPVMFMSGPEHLRSMFQGDPSFHSFYISPLGSVPTMLVGVFLAHLLRELNEKGFKAYEHKVNIRQLYNA